MIVTRSEILRKEQRRFLGRFQRLLYQQFSIHVVEVDVTHAIAAFFRHTKGIASVSAIQFLQRAASWSDHELQSNFCSSSKYSSDEAANR
jgi:hypothetical protein